MDDPTVTIPKLPNDVIVEILTWLPVKPLLKFRCVCKSWRTLISSQQFVRSHLKNSKLDPNFTTHRLLIWWLDKLKQCSANSVHHEPVSEAFDLSWPVKTRRFRAVGSCNDLVCVSMDDQVSNLILWNPSTRIWKKLPDVREKFCGCRDYGFGYDKSSDDYKVVGFFHEKIKNSYTYEAIVQVYSLRNDKWKRIKTFVDDDWALYGYAMFVNGKLYWVASEEDKDDFFYHIVSFDLEEEEDEILQIPSYVKLGTRVDLGASGGSLLVLCNHDTSANVWIMDCCNENWSKLVTMPRPNGEPHGYDLMLYVKHGRILFLCDVTLVIFDVKDCSFSYPKVRNWGNYLQVGTYLESLVSPLG